MDYIEFDSYEKMSRHAANLVAADVILHHSSVLGLATGSTPLGTYRRLVELYKSGDVDFSKVMSVNLDEYVGIPADHPQSYRYFMNTNLFDKVNIDSEKTYVPNGNAPDTDAECKRYDKLIADIGGVDIQLLGIGNNGHIGFNEPGSSFDEGTHKVKLSESTIKANARFFENENEVPREAITVGMKTIMSARRIVLMAAGENKKAILDKALNGDITPEVPASILRLHGKLTVLYTPEKPY